MEEKLYQNIDLPQNNPLKVEEVPTETNETKVKKPLNPKILLLIILGAIIFVLLIASLVVTQVRQRQSNLPSSIPTSNPIVATPTPSDSLIPTQYQESFKQVEQSLTQDPDLPVPQIDPKIGL